MDTDHPLKAVNLCCIRQHKILFSNFSFTLKAGETLLIEGENGSGKSSLLRLLASVATPAQGDIFWHGCSIYTNYTQYRENIHYMGHENSIKLGLTVAENLQWMQHLSLSTIYKSEVVLDFLQLHAYQNQPAKYLSAGQKRRLALAKFFLLPRKLWLLDEPFTSLDTNTQQIFLRQLETHLNNGGMCIISSHHELSFKNTNVKTVRLAIR